MMRLALVSALLVSAMAIGANAGPKIGGAMPDKPVVNLLMIYNTDPALQCYRTAAEGVALRDGLDHCNTAVLDPLMNYRAETFVNRGIIRYDMGDRKGALSDFDNALEYNPSLGDAYLNQALVLVAEESNDLVSLRIGSSHAEFVPRAGVGEAVANLLNLLRQANVLRGERGR